MAKEDGREMEWVSFGPGVRISGSSTETPAVAKTESVSLWRRTVEGEMSVVVTDKAMRRPVVVPWHNVGSCEYVASP